MTYEATTIKPLEGELSSSEEAEIVKQVKELISSGKAAMEPARTKVKRAYKAYNLQHDRKTLDKTRTNAYLPWVYTAIESGHARLVNSMLPNDEDIFSIMGETEDDNEACEFMSEALKSYFKDGGVITELSRALKAAEFGYCAVKMAIKKVEKQYSVAIDAPVLDEIGEPILDELGQPMLQKQVQTQSDLIYYGPSAELIPLDDFFIYPLNLPMERTSYGHRVWRYLDELEEVQAQGFYRNIDQIRADMGDNDTAFKTGNADSSGDGRKQGLEVWELWLPRVKVGKRGILKNYIATVVEGKYLVRFEPNPYDFGIVPFIYVPFIEDVNVDQGLQNTGHGLVDKALEIQKIGNFIVNQICDESKVKLYGTYKYIEDGSFNPGAFVTRPGGLVRVADINNLQPINPNLGQLSFGFQELQYWEQQFEIVTNVPKFLKGVIDEGPGQTTATEKRLTAEGNDQRFRALGRHLNEKLLKPVVLFSYVLTRQWCIQDPIFMGDLVRRVVESKEEVQQPDGSVAYRELTPDKMLAKVPDMPPLSKIDINVVGFENVLNKSENAAKLERFVAGVANFAQADPSALMHLKTEEIIEGYRRDLGVDQEFVRDESEVVQFQIKQKQMDIVAKMGLQDALARIGVDPQMLMQSLEQPQAA